MRSGKLWVAFFLTLPLVNPYLRGDGNGYYAYVRSLTIDHDLQFEDEYRHGDPAFRSLVFDDDGQVRPEMRLHPPYLRNQWAVGPSLLWTPFFLAAHGVVRALNASGVAIPADGYSAPYRWFCALGTALYGFLAVLLGCQLADRYASPRAGRLAMAAVWVGSSLPVYMYFLPFHVPALSAFAVALFLTVWMNVRDRPSPKRWLCWGLVAGLMVEVYNVNAVLLLLPAIQWIIGVRAVARTRGVASAFASGAVDAGGFAAAMTVVLLPHFMIKAIIHGSPFRTGYADRFFWSDPRLWQVGLSAEHGMFVWTPVLIIAVAGLLLLWRVDRAVAGSVVAAFGSFYYVVASYQNWHGQSSFGSRFFVSFTPLFVLGLAVAIDRVNRRWLSVTVLAVLMAWNIGFVFQWGTRIIPNRGPVSLVQVARNQITVVPQRLGLFASRYLTDRRTVTREVEQIDLRDAETYRAKR